MSEDIKTLFPGKEITVGGETFTISPFTFGQLPKVAQCFAAIQSKMSSGNMIEIASAGGEDLLALLCISVKKPRAWFDTLPSDEGLALMATVIEQNRDFFVQRMSPVLARLNQAVTGAQSLPASSAPATTGEASAATP